MDLSIQLRARCTSSVRWQEVRKLIVVVVVVLVGVLTGQAATGSGPLPPVVGRVIQSGR